MNVYLNGKLLGELMNSVINGKVSVKKPDGSTIEYDYNDFTMAVDEPYSPIVVKPHLQL